MGKMSVVSKRWLAVVRLGCVMALAGCGSSGGSGHAATATGSGSAGSNGEASKSPGQILADAAAAIRDAHSYAMRGELTANGQAVRVKLLAPSSTALELVMSSPSGSDEIIALATGSYIRGDSAFWSAHAGPRGSLLANHWIQVPPAQVQSLTAAVGHFAPATLSRCLVEDHGSLSIAGRTTVAGRPAIVIKDAGNIPGDAPGLLAVATSGPPYPLRVTGLGAKRPGGKIDVCNDGKADNTRGTFTLSQFGAVPPISAPSNPIRLGQTAAT
jgi:hypothetical protein